MTKLLGVIGDPISHSLSPVIHNSWLRSFGIDATYEAMQVKDGEVLAALESLARRDVVGINVTLPHKHSALEASATVSPAAEMIGAANTLTYQGPKTWHADNTDAPGFLKALEWAGIANISGKKVLLLGAGGSAKALAYALKEADASLTILNRTVAKAEALATQYGSADSAYGSIDQLTDYQTETDLIINTLSLGHSGDYLALPSGKERLFFDISYGRGAAAQLQEAAQKGWQTQDGLGMLVAQAAESFKIWFGETPDTVSALKRCRDLVAATS